MDLSIIVPCHDTEAYIQMLLDSFKKQSLSSYNVEYIFVLDSCKDNTKERILKANLNNCKILECNFKSCGLSRNLGKNNSTGDYIWFIDSDDWLLWSNTFEILLDIMKKNNFNVLRFDWATTPLWPGIETVDGKKGIPGMIWQFMLKRSFIDEYKLEFTNIQPAEDLEYCQKILDIYNKDEKYIPFYHQKMYFYNYGRSNSNMNQYQKTGKIVIN